MGLNIKNTSAFLKIHLYNKSILCKLHACLYVSLRVEGGGEIVELHENIDECYDVERGLKQPIQRFVKSIIQIKLFKT